MRGIPRLPDASLARLLVLRALVLWVFLHCMALALVTATTLERPDAAALRLGGRAYLDASADALARAGLFLVPARDLLPTSLSIGDSLACAVIRAPRCLVADKPFRGVSPLDAECLCAEFRRAAAAGAAVIVSGHELPALFAIASRVVWCTDGTTRNLGSPARATADWRFMSELVGPRGL